MKIIGPTISTIFGAAERSVLTPICDPTKLRRSRRPCCYRSRRVIAGKYPWTWLTMSRGKALRRSPRLTLLYHPWSRTRRTPGLGKAMRRLTGWTGALQGTFGPLELTFPPRLDIQAASRRDRGKPNVAIKQPTPSWVRRA